MQAISPEYGKRWIKPSGISSQSSVVKLYPTVLGQTPAKRLHEDSLTRDLYPIVFMNIIKFVLKNKTIVPVGDLMLLIKETLSIYVEIVVIVANKF